MNNIFILMDNIDFIMDDFDKGDAQHKKTMFSSVLLLFFMVKKGLRSFFYRLSFLKFVGLTPKYFLKSRLK